MHTVKNKIMEIFPKCLRKVNFPNKIGNFSKNMRQSSKRNTLLPKC